VAPLLLWIINQFSPQAANSILTALAVGLGLPTLMRTKFTVAKRLVGGEGEGEGDLSINIGWLYEQFQNLCKTQIDLALIAHREKLLRGLVDKYPHSAQLVEIAHYVLQERALFTQEDVQRMQNYIEGIKSSTTIPEVAKRVTLARFILDTGGPGYVQELIRSEPSKPLGPGSIRQ